MKKHSLAEFFKSKSFYALLCVGALAIIAITAVSLNQSSNQDQSKKNLVDLNEPQVADGDEGNQANIQPGTNNETSSTAAKNEDGTSQTEVAKSDSNNQVTNPVSNGSNLENDAEDDPKSAAANPSATTDKTADSNSTQTANAAGTTASNTESTKDSEEVMNPETLYFDAEDGLLWPVTGNILMDYSVDRVIYDATLEQFRTNPAVVIDAEAGTKVVSAAKGVITSIKKEDETGLTVTQSIGNGYSLVYGQLKGVKAKKGDVLEAGEVLGLVAEPSKYYTVEGSNLYFQVIKDKETVNPMLLFKDSSED